MALIFIGESSMVSLANLRIWVLFVLCVCLSACQPDPSKHHMLTGFIGDHRTPLTQWTASGGHWFAQGQQLSIIMPIDLFFDHEVTARIAPNQRQVVMAIADVIAHYAKLYPHAMVSVHSFLDKQGSARHREQTALRYTQTMAAYLWHAGVPRERIEMRGSKNSSTCYSPKQCGFARRIEIRLNPYVS